MNDEKKNIKDTSKTFEELKNLQASVKKFKFGDLVVPLLSVIVLTLLTIFVYIPMISSAIESVAQTKSTNQKITDLTSLNSSLTSIDLNDFNTNLSNAREVIPFSLQVSDFLSYVEASAKKHGLLFQEIVSGDVTIIGTGDKNTVENITKGVSGPLKYLGSVDQITKFLDELQTTSPYIILADPVSIKKVEGGNWEVAISVIGYYLNQNALPKLDIYREFKKYSDNTEILAIFSSKASQSN